METTKCSIASSNALVDSQWVLFNRRRPLRCKSYEVTSLEGSLKQTLTQELRTRYQRLLWTPEVHSMFTDQIQHPFALRWHNPNHLLGEDVSATGLCIPPHRIRRPRLSQYCASFYSFGDIWPQVYSLQTSIGFYQWRLWASTISNADPVRNQDVEHVRKRHNRRIVPRIGLQRLLVNWTSAPSHWVLEIVTRKERARAHIW